MTKLEEDLYETLYGNLPLTMSNSAFVNLLRKLREEDVQRAAGVVKKYIDKACQEQIEYCAMGIGLSSAVWVYPHDSEKIKQWIRRTPLVKVNGITE